jgi:hypothetical protein
MRDRDEAVHSPDRLSFSFRKSTITRTFCGRSLDIDLFGDLAGILSVATQKERPPDESDPSIQQVRLVAGAGFEPATFRL